MKRRLTTIFYADAAGYSRAMERDEQEAFAALRRARAAMEELFARHDGRRVNTWGDAVIAEFPSVVEAVRCAVEVQEALGGGLPGDAAGCDRAEALRFRIGVNLGDVMVDGADLYGDGVNVAARLQELAEPGGVMVSGLVRELTRKQVEIDFRHIGPSAVKSMEEKVDAWALDLPVPGPAAFDTPPPPWAAGGAAPGGTLDRALGRAERLWHWVMAQPRRVRRAAGFVLFFVTLNLLFGGIANPWFLFPSAPFLLYILLHARRARRGR